MHRSAVSCSCAPSPCGRLASARAHLFTALGLAIAGSRQVITRRAPHVLMLVADDLGYNDVGWRDSSVLTPHLDALRSSGVSLDNYYVQQVCSPTRGSLLTGRFPVHLGYNGVIQDTNENGIPLDQPTIANILAKAGYVSHLIGKWHVGMFLPALLPHKRGFTSAFGYLCGAEGYWSHGGTMGCSNASGPVFDLDLYNNSDVARGFDGVYETEMYTHQAEHIVREHDMSKNLFLYAAPNNVHTPLGAPQRFYDLYNGTNNTRLTFSATVAALDEFAANLTSILASRGLWKDTLFIFTTDNGGNLHGGGNNWPLRGGKFTFWEGGLKGTGFVAGAGITRTGHARGLMHAVDWFATIVAMAGIPPVSGIDGVDMTTMLNGGEAAPRTEIPHLVTDKSEGNAAIRVGDMKLLVGFPGVSNKQGCSGGCWCPLPDESGRMPCVSPCANATLRADKPPSAACSAAFEKSGCAKKAPTIKACNRCLEAMNASFAPLHCGIKDPKHWCNNQYGPTPGPGPAPGPAPGPSPECSPCSTTPCLFNITADPLEKHDLAAALPHVVTELQARIKGWQATYLSSPFPSVHNISGACAAALKNGNAWGPWG